MTPSFVLLEDRKNTIDKCNYLFTHPNKEWKCFKQEDLIVSLLEMEQFQKKGFYLAGYVAYEASYFLNHILDFEFQWDKTEPLLHFYAFEDVKKINQTELEHFLNEKAQNLEAPIVYDLNLQQKVIDYEKHFCNIQKHLYQGDSYQVNLTTKYHFNLQGSQVKLYQFLRDRQRVAYGGFLQFDDYEILSFSPELFFRKTGTLFETKPMKGTMPRDNNPLIDEANKNILKTNEKLVSENIIIVDLLRNDLSMISTPGSVRVNKLLDVESFETVHQMSTEIESQVSLDLSFTDILKNIFPCGSITGAPKKRTMQIIEKEESESRHIYTGAIGFISPNNDMVFNVAIRTLFLKDGKGELGVGGGLIYDSNVNDEYKELQLKAKFFTEMPSHFQLIESILYHPTHGYFLLEEHLNRIQNSAHIFNFKYKTKEINRVFVNLKKEMQNKTNYKVRFILEKSGKIHTEFKELAVQDLKDKPQVVLYNTKSINSHNILLQHKTLHSSVRDFYNEIATKFSDYDDVIFVNERGQITESSKANLFIDYAGKIFTPPLSVGALPGVMRSFILENNPSIKEKILYPDDLIHADKIWLSNSVRGLFEVHLCQNY
jgi:para-aminobenzoate synthetase/4-amino-4-deoxychorismate lyase